MARFDPAATMPPEVGRASPRRLDPPSRAMFPRSIGRAHSGSIDRAAPCRIARPGVARRRLSGLISRQSFPIILRVVHEILGIRAVPLDGRADSQDLMDPTMRRLAHKG